MGRCKVCNQKVYDVNKIAEEVKVKMKEYSVTAISTILLLMAASKLSAYLTSFGLVAKSFIKSWKEMISLRHED
jgi:tRNA U54 and U55 pseudouridine synthase Pus10